MLRGGFHSKVLTKTTKILAGKNIDVYTEGFKPRVEYNPVTKLPERVFIPECPDNASDELIGAMQGYIDHECGHILESNNDDICDDSKPKLWHYIHNCIEDPRINAKMSDRFPGCEANIRSGYNYMFNRIDEETGRSAYSKEAVDEIDMADEEAVKDAQVRYSSVWFAKKAGCRFHGPKFDDLELDRLFDPLEAKMSPRALDALSRMRSPEEVRSCTDYFVDFFHKEFDEEGSPTPAPGKGSGKPEKSRLEEATKLEDELGEAIKQEIEHLAKKGRKNWYFSDRWDSTFDKFDIVKKFKPTTDLVSFENETKSITNYLTKDLRRLLESRNRRWWVGGYKSGKLNQKALHSVRVGNDRIFSRKSEVRAVKAAVSLLIDLSGSMCGEKVQIASQAAYSFAMVLEQLRVPYEVWGFSTYAANKEKTAEWIKFAPTIDPTVAQKVIAEQTVEHFFAFKRFEENFDLLSKTSLIAASEGNCGMHNNEDSRHVKAALERLAVRPEDQKTLFVFSDGMPCYSPGNIKNTMEMLKHLDSVSMSHYGVEMFGIGIQDASVKEYYKNFKVVNNLAELPAALFGFLRTRI